MIKRWLASINLKFFWELNSSRFSGEEWQNKIFPQHPWLVRQIKKLRPKSILEAGCGFGRNLQYLIDQGISPSFLTGTDFSTRLLKLARRDLSHLGINFFYGNILALPFHDKSFDLVFTHGVLMHVKPDEVKQSLSELVRVAKKHVVIIEEIRSRPRQLNFFTWAHDYDKIIAGLPVKVLTRVNGKYLLRWYVLKKLNTPIRASSTRKS